MLLAAKYIHGFVERHPTIKVLALSFLLMIGMVLIADGLEVKVPKGYVYFAMGFSVFVELLDMRLRKVQREAPVRLHEAYAQDDPKP
jgi:predicted tellurium resistance membrane protein TerC